MHPFISYTLTWWQFGLLKSAMLAFGLALGATFPEMFAVWIPVLWVVFVVPSVYLVYVAFRQM